MTYETRYCAFVDILGFRNIIRDLEAGRIKPDELREMLATVHRPPLAELSQSGDSDFRAQSISDAVCLSVRPSLEGVNVLLWNLESLTLALLSKGYFVRGAVVKGRLHHDESVVFGDGLVRAFTLESTVARFPRIMISSEVRSDYFEFRQKEGKPLEDLIWQSADGPYFLNALLQIPQAFGGSDSQKWRERQILRFNLMAWNIQERFTSSFDDPRVFEKIQWFAKYWNHVVHPYKAIEKIIGPGVTLSKDPP